MIKRIIFSEESSHSVFLLGARKNGKSSFLDKRYPNSTYFDLLKPEIANKYLNAPERLRIEIESLKKT